MIAVLLTAVGFGLQLFVVCTGAALVEETLSAGGKVEGHGRAPRVVVLVIGLLDGGASKLPVIAAVAVGAAVLWAIVRAWERNRVGVIAVAGADRFRHSVVRQIYRLPAFSSVVDSPGELINAMTGRNASVLRAVLVSSHELMMREPIVVVGATLAAIAVAPVETVIAIACVAVAGVAVGQLIRPLRSAIRKLAGMRRDCELVMEAILKHAEVARANGYDEYDRDRLTALQERWRGLEAAQERFTSWLWPLVVLVWIITGLVLALLFGWSFVGGRITAGDAFFVVSAIGLAAVSVQRMLTLREELVRHEDQVQKFLAILELDEAVYQLPDARFVPPPERELRFDRVSVERQGEPLLREVTFAVPRDSKVAVLAVERRSALALAFLVPRLYDPDEGRILIDGTDIRQATLESLRAHMGLILRDSYTMLDTVRNNITGGDPTVPLTKVVEAAKLAHAHQFIQRLKDGYDTLIGPGGVQLTTGERYRIALARLVLKDPAIAIIEEPDAPLDEDTRQLIDDTLARFCPGRIVLVLAGRLSTLKSADQVILLNRGAIEDRGTHSELTQRSELYRHLQYALAHRRKLVLAASHRG